MTVLDDPSSFIQSRLIHELRKAITGYDRNTRSHGDRASLAKVGRKNDFVVITGDNRNTRSNAAGASLQSPFLVRVYAF